MSRLCGHTWNGKTLCQFHENNHEPTKEEINIFRLWQCPDCGHWISLLGLTDKSPQYEEVKQKFGFEKAYRNIRWHGDGLYLYPVIIG